MIKIFKIALITSLIASLYTGCKSEDKPEDILSEQQMMSFFLDIYEAESSLTSLGMERDTVLAIFSEYEDVLFERHNLNKEQYQKSLTYYYDNPGKLEKIYEILIDTLTLRESKIQAIQEAERKKRDSIRNINLKK